MNLLLTELTATAALTGLIWLVQLVHYPSFHFVEASRFRAFHTMHTRQITWIVLPLMVTELGLSVYHCWEASGAWNKLVPLVLVILLWASTFLWQVPLHRQLATRKDTQIIERLVRSNWWRTFLWTIRTVWLWYWFRV